MNGEAMKYVFLFCGTPEEARVRGAEAALAKVDAAADALDGYHLKSVRARFPWHRHA
jgi:hypothetical protein